MIPPIPTATLIVQPGQPLPNPVPAGSVIEILGTYAGVHTSPNTLKIHGTPSQPVTIRSVERPDLLKAIISGAWQVTGSDYTLEGLVSTGGIDLVAPNTRATVRNCEFRGDSLVGHGLGVNSYDGLAWNRSITLYRNWIHDQGDLTTLVDQDCHGINIRERAEDVWAVGNVLDRNSGDGLQINSGTSRSTRRIFVLENAARGNKQYGLWCKQASDIVFARNVVSNHRPSNSSLGACVGGQYGPENFWIVDNVLNDADYGVHLASDLGDGKDGKTIVVLGNTISNIRDSDASDPAQGPLWASAAISLMGGTYRYVAGNTITTSTRAISAAPSGYTFIDVPNNAQALRDYFARVYGSR